MYSLTYLTNKEIGTLKGDAATNSKLTLKCKTRVSGQIMSSEEADVGC